VPCFVSGRRKILLVAWLVAREGVKKEKSEAPPTTAEDVVLGGYAFLRWGLLALWLGGLIGGVCEQRMGEGGRRKCRSRCSGRRCFPPLLAQEGGDSRVATLWRTASSLSRGDQ
jgi:hypothetical protein